MQATVTLLDVGGLAYARAGSSASHVLLTEGFQ